MGHDPWTELRSLADDVRLRIEADLGVRHPGSLEEASEERGLFALATFPYAKELRRDPTKLAAQAAATRVRKPFRSLAASGGYVNFVVDPADFADFVLSSARTMGPDYGHLPRKSERILLEHTSVNPTGPIHVGRGRNPILGDALGRLFRLAGYPVVREYFVNDVGKQMVLQFWGTRHLGPKEVDPPDRAKEDYRYLKHYQKAAAMIEEDPKLNADIMLLIQRHENGDVALTKDIRAVGEMVLTGILKTLARIDIAFDSFSWESDLIVNGSVHAVIERLKPLAQEEDGAFFLDLQSYGLEGEAAKYFFVTRYGTSLYTTRDIAYHLKKMERCDVAINVLGEDQKLTFLRLKAVLKMLGLSWSPETIFQSFVSLPEGRMSTRKGVVVNLDDLIDEAVERAYIEVAKRREDLSEERRREIAEVVGVGAVRYNLVRIQAEKKIEFRWEEALNFEGNSAPFLQYAHARTCGILRKAGGFVGGDPRLLLHPSEHRLLRWVAKLPATIAEAAAERKVHTLAAFAVDFVSHFNEFYRDCPVLAAEPALRAARLSLVDASRIVLQNALHCLGVRAPEEM